jgi:hypothetical protein
MDFFKFVTEPGTPTLLTSGQMVDGYRSLEWVERYLEPSSFTLKAPATDDFQAELPIGTFVSHSRSDEVFLVEDHYIDDADEPMITITGRSFESWLENRIVGTERAHPATGEQKDYVMVTPDYTWNQAVTLIDQHVITCYYNSNELPYVQVAASVTGTGTQDEQSFPREGLHTTLMALLAVDNCGIKAIRPGRPGAGAVPSYITLRIHRGVDRSATISFSYHSGDITGAEYLRSSQPMKNVCVVTGKWVEVLVDQTAGKTLLNKRVMRLDATDIDERYDVAPAGATLTYVQNRMISRAKRAIAAQKTISLQNIEVASDAKRFVYGIDYGLGDTVMVRSNYNVAQKMRVTEYVEIEDENGVSAYPTLEELETA